MTPQEEFEQWMLAKNGGEALPVLEDTADEPTKSGNPSFVPKSPLNDPAFKDYVSTRADSSRKNKLIAGLGEASGDILNAFSSQTNDPTFFRNMAKEQTGQDLQDKYMLEAQKAQNDLAAKKATVTTPTYSYMQTDKGIVGVNTKDPTDVQNIGYRGKPEKTEAPSAVSGYVIQGTDQPVYSLGGKYTDISGNPVPGIEPKPDKSQNQVAKTNRESDYRYNKLNTNAQELKDTILGNKEKGTKGVGTFEMFGDKGSSMDSKIYQMAVDFAKLVDPDSVAREGEVAAAKKYMLPVRDWGGMGTSNETAGKMIDNYIADLDSRLAARKASQADTSNIAGNTLPPGSAKGKGDETVQNGWVYSISTGKALRKAP